MRFKLMKRVALSSTLAAALALAAAPVIGTIVAKGAFRLDNASVRGNATLFEGASIETATVESSVELSSGAKVSLEPSSKGRFFGDRVILEKGAGDLEKSENLKFEARGLTIQPETGNASARIALSGAARIDVSALTGSLRVLNSHGLLVASVNAGRTIEFEPQPANAPTKISGCLVFKNGHYLVSDETTNVVVEVAGPGLDKEKGNRVEVYGGYDPTATPVSDASEFVRVASVRRLGKGCAVTAAAGKGGKAGAAGGAAGAAAGLSMTTVAIVGGVAAAGVVGGLAAAHSLPGQGSGSVSR
ncbi:MAG TPA: hypothetical protein VKS01_11015 [Bryobacteraceae bacterium]|nr:hypothetical protein [Bryobacteraceae bacterium]